MTSTAGSTTRSAESVSRLAVVVHGKPETTGDAPARLAELARSHDVELVAPDREPDLAVVLGGDGTMLRALQRFLGTRTPVIGVNFGRVGFLSSIRPDEMAKSLERVFAGDYLVLELSTLLVEAAGARHSAINDVVVRSADVGRMVALGWAIGDEDLGRQPCDGIICATPTGSTAYNLSNGGPVLVWGLEAMAVTFVAPHSLDARPLVVARDQVVRVANVTPDVAVKVIVDGHVVTEVASGGEIRVCLDERRSLLATLPEATFFRRYRETFAS